MGNDVATVQPEAVPLPSWVQFALPPLSPRTQSTSSRQLPEYDLRRDLASPQVEPFEMSPLVHYLYPQGVRSPSPLGGSTRMPGTYDVIDTAVGSDIGWHSDKRRQRLIALDDPYLARGFDDASWRRLGEMQPPELQL